MRVYSLKERRVIGLSSIRATISACRALVGVVRGRSLDARIRVRGEGLVVSISYTAYGTVRGAFIQPMVWQARIRAGLVELKIAAFSDLVFGPYIVGHKRHLVSSAACGPP